MKKIIFIFLSFFLRPQIAFGQGVRLQNPLNPNNSPSGINDVWDLLEVFFEWAISLVGIVAVVAIILAGYQMIIGGDDPKKIATAKNRIKWALIGLAVVLLAFVIVRVIGRVLTTGGLE